MSAIRRIDHDRVLDLWALGHGSVGIARIMSLKGPETARTIIGRARRRGDPRALSRGARPAAASVALPPWLTESATIEAARRAMPLDAFCLELLGTCLREGLTQAVLDDTPDTQEDESRKEA